MQLRDGDDAGVGESAFHVEDLAQQVDRGARGEQVEGDAGDELVGLQHDGEEDEDQRQEQRAEDRQQDADEPGVEGVGSPHGAERPGQHHAFHGDVEHPGVIGERAAQRCQQDRGGARDHAVDQPGQDVHVASSFPSPAGASAVAQAAAFQHLRGWRRSPAPARPAAPAMISLGTLVISSIPSAPVWMARRRGRRAVWQSCRCWPRWRS